VSRRTPTRRRRLPAARLAGLRLALWRGAAAPARRSRSRWPTRCAARWRRRWPSRRRPSRSFADVEARLAYLRWLGAASERLKRRKAEHHTRIEFLETVWYESRRAGLETALVLGLIQVESGFRKYAISSAGARGYMQVMPFWARTIGDGDASAAVPPADQPALRLRDPAPLPRPRARRPVHGAGPLQRQPRPREYPNLVFGARRQWDVAPA
jgi:soluble lytic murein transglycosylase-like protein